MANYGYIERRLSATILAVSQSFRVVYLGGPRQVGKTTLLLHLLEKQKMNVVSLDDPEKRHLAKTDPALFLQQFPAPVFIDEAQYAPELFPYIKMIVDTRKQNGLYWLSGSQHFSMIRGLQESLAGRVGIVSLLGVSLAEEERIPLSDHPFSPATLPASCQVSLTLPGLFQKIFRGSFPALVSGESKERERFYASYIQTYLDRDVVSMFGIQKIDEFHRVLGLVAAKTAQILNVSALASDASLSVSTVRSWLSVLEASGMIYFLRPYTSNLSKRMTKSPKMYVLDTGLAAFLTKWQSGETLMHGAMAGAMFETFVVSEILKSYLFRGREAPIYFYRDKDKREVDMIFDIGGTLYPLEIKMGAHIRSEDMKSIHFLRQNHSTIGQAVVVSACESPLPYDRETTIIPAWCIQ